MPGRDAIQSRNQRCAGCASLRLCQAIKNGTGSRSSGGSRTHGSPAWSEADTTPPISVEIMFDRAISGGTA